MGPILNLKYCFTIYISDKKIDEFQLRNNIFSRLMMKITGKLFSRTYNIEDDLDDGEWQELVIEVDQTFIPDDILHNGDKRELGLMISGISVN